ncbi:MAG: redox-regulated ATPase YchF [Candidatus Jacksonbacteria bacterium]
MKIGIVGLPNVGKSTLFKALTKKEVPRENYPFCTIEPNVGIVAVPDFRLEKLALASKSAQIIPTVIEFVDIAGLVRGAHKGEGLGNKFLSHIKEVDAICQVVRIFKNKDIHHVENKIDPQADMETVNLELIMKDLELIIKRIDDLLRASRTDDKENEIKLKVLQKIKNNLDNGQRADQTQLTADEILLIKDLNLLTLKPVLYVFNTDDDHLKNSAIDGLYLNAQIEAELADLEGQELLDYLQELNLTDTGLNKLIQASYKLLDLITFFTSGEKETRGWTVRRGAKAPHAAGKIHSDIKRGFIRAETVGWKELVDAGTWSAARDRGLIRIEGKEYQMQDGDVCYFRFGG